MDLLEVSEIVWKQCLEAKQGENAIIVFDKTTEEIADALYESGKKFCNVSMVETFKSKMHGQEPEKKIAKLMFKSGII
jgi:hypothetical protein